VSPAYRFPPVSFPSVAAAAPRQKTSPWPLAGGAAELVDMLSRERGCSKLPANSKLTFMNKKASFADRVALLDGAAEDLRAIHRQSE
jgi:hypothetical protein